MSRSADTPRRERALAVGLCVLASSGALVCAGRTWAVGTVAALPPLPARELVLTGTQAGAPTRGLAALGLAGAVAVVAARGWPRVAVGVVLLLAGGTIAVVGTAFDAGSGFAAQGMFPMRVRRTGWSLLAAGCGAGRAAAGRLAAGDPAGGPGGGTGGGTLGAGAVGGARPRRGPHDEVRPHPG